MGRDCREFDTARFEAPSADAGGSRMWHVLQHVELNLMEQLARDCEPEGYVPPRLRKLLGEMTSVEKRALLGEPAPAWSMAAIRMRIALAGLSTNPAYRTEAPADLTARVCDVIAWVAHAGECKELDCADASRIRDALAGELTRLSLASMTSFDPTASPRSSQTASPSSSASASSRPTSFLPVEPIRRAR
jgi:hypothetical protein